MFRFRPARDRDVGFTLVELLIAIVIMGIAITVLVAAMGNVFVASANSRGYSRLESNMRNFAEAIQQKASFKTEIRQSGGIGSGDSQFTIADPVSSFGDSRTTQSGSPTNFPFYIVVDAETMRVTGMVGSDPTTATVIKVDRHYGGTTATSHADGASVVQLFGCPSGPIGEDTNTADSSPTSNGDYGHNYFGYLYPSGFKTTDSNVKITISDVKYWDPVSPPVGTSGQFNWDQASCWDPSNSTSAGYSNVCPNSQVLPQCDEGLEQVTLDGTDKTNGASTTATLQILVRRGSQ